MSIPVSCGQCGWQATVKDALAGRKAKCPTCGAPIAITRAAGPAEVPAASSDTDDGPPLAYGLAEPPRSAERAAAPKPATRPKPGPRTRIESRAKGRERASPGLHLNETAVGGLLMMGGAALWFALGYFLRDSIYIYPPFLFVIGLILFFHGVATRNQAP